MDTKLTYREKLEQQLKEWDAQINLFAVRAASARIAAKIKAEHGIDCQQDGLASAAVDKVSAPEPIHVHGEKEHKKAENLFQLLPVAALTLAVLTAAGCAIQAPEESLKTDDVELALASEVEEERRVESFNNIAVSANFDPATGQLVVAGQLPRQASVRVENGATNQLLGIAQAVSPFAVDSASSSGAQVATVGVAPWQLVLTAAQLAELRLTTVPCTLRLQTPQGTVLVPVQSTVSAGQTLACANGTTGQAQVQGEPLVVTRSTWNSQTGSLIVAGSGAGPRQTVTFLDVSSGQVIGIDEANATGTFRLRLTSVASPPCEIQVVTDSREVIADVEGAPLACGVPGAVVGATNLAPNTIITIPSTESMVTLGTTVLFDAIGIDPDNNIPLTYKWSFDGAGPDSFLRSPTMKFDRGGVYRVSATVTDALGARDLTPDVRTIIVQAASTGPIGSVLAPNGQILLPAANVTVNVGQGVNFSAVGSSVSGLALTYVWNFGGAAANVASQNPGPVIFSQPGIYTISMTAVDALGYSDVTPDTRVISVMAGPATGTTTLPPNGEITAPMNDVITAQVGQSIVFSAIGTDPDGNIPLTYMWDFGGAAAPSPQQTSSIVFSQPGNYRVTLYVFDSMGAVDPTPAVRNVVVQGTGQATPGGTAPNGTILSPSQDVSINVGQSVFFAGTGADPNTGSSLIFAWDFDGGALDTAVQNPGAVFFGRAGVYRVRMTARNSFGLVDATPAERIITVIDPLQSSNVPNGLILSPTTDVTIQAGQSINFAATATDLDGVVGIVYEWDFGFAVPITQSRTQNPGLVEFRQSGTYRVSLRVRDPSGLSDPTPESRVINVLGNGTSIGNQAPDSVISSPATDLTLNKGGSINFIGAGTDPEGNPLTYRWLATGVTIPFPTQSNAGLVTFAQSGTYWVSLVATDSFGLSDPVPEVRTITVRDLSPTNSDLNGQITSPSASNVTTIVAGQFVTFSAISTNSNSAAAPIYTWDFDGGAPSSSLQNPGSVSFSQAGMYRVTLRVSDNLGGFDPTPDVRVIIVQSLGVASQIAPEGSINSPAGDVQIGLGQTLNFRASGTDADNNVPLSFRWNFDGAAPASTAQDAGSVIFTRAGVYSVALTVTDSTGVSDSTPAIRKVTVLGSGLPPDAGSSAPVAIMVSPAANQTIQVGQGISFLGSGTNPTGNAALNYVWTFGGSGLPSTSQQSPGLLTFNVAGTYTVTLNVSNNAGVADPTPETRVITVTSQGSSTVPSGAPDGMILTPATNQIISVGDSVHFMGHVMSSTAGQTVRYVWNFFGGAPSLTELSPGDVMFSTPGVYQVMFTVQDGQGLSDPTPAMRTITVNAR